VDDRVGASEEPREFGRGDVCCDPLRLRELEARPAPGDADDGVDGRLVRESLEETGADISAGSRDHDAHTR
jgi:hypothetical protein